MARILIALGLVLLLAVAARATEAPPGLVTVEGGCKPAAIGAVTLKNMGFHLEQRWPEDRGFAVEEWSAELGRAVVMLLRSPDGSEARCVLLMHAPGEPS